MTRWPLVLAGWLAAAVSANAACPTAPAGYIGWGSEAFAPADGRSIGADGLTVTAPVGGNRFWIAEQKVIDSWSCMSFWFPGGTEGSRIGAGIVFWKLGPRDFHVAIIQRDGVFEIWRFGPEGWSLVRDDRSFTPLTLPPRPAVRSGAGTRNEDTYNQIEVVTLGDMVRAALRNASICAGFRFHIDEGVAGTIGVVFRFVDQNDFHVAQVGQGGAISVFRFSGGSWRRLGQAQSPDVIGAVPDPRSSGGNTLEAVIRGDRIQVIVNSQRVLTVEAAAPKGPWVPGLYAQPENGKALDAVITHVQIIEMK